MSRSTTDSRQITLRQFLEQIASKSHYDGTSDSKPANQTELDNLLKAIDDELTPPLRLSASTTPDLVVSVGAAVITNSESARSRSIPHVGALLPNDFSSGTITFPAASGGTITVSPGNNGTLTVASGNYIKVLIYMDVSGDLNVLPGLENASEALASVYPPPSKTLPIGYIVLQNVGGTIQNVTQSDIVQFGSGAGGGGGAGDASAFLETLKNRIVESPFNLVTPYIVSIDEDDLLDGSSTASYSLVDNTINFTGTGQTLITVPMADPDEFLNNDNALTKVELMAQWRLTDLDPAATYEVSRNGGAEWQAVTMTRIGASDTYRGIKEFTDTETPTTLDSYINVENVASLDITNQQELGQEIAISSKVLMKSIDLDFTKIGSPVGNVYVSICEDNSGDPGTIIAESHAINIATLSSGSYSVDMDAYLVTGAYHIKLRTDDAYKASYVGGSHVLSIKGKDFGVAPAPYTNKYNGTVWSATTFKLNYDIKGIEIDLRARITSSTSVVKLEALGLFYDAEPSGVSTASTKQREVFHFSGDDDVTEFTLTNFIPEPDLVKVYDVGTGQVYTFGAFTIQGRKLVFDAGQFLAPGETVTLVMDQTTGGSYDNSDLNALLLANNHLGSTDALIDKSVNGRGIFLRRPDGTLREIAIDDSDNIVVYSV